MPTVYIDRTKPDASGITLLCESESSEPSPAASPHCHSFFEVTLVVRGSCKVFTSRHHILLIPCLLYTSAMALSLTACGGSGGDSSAAGSGGGASNGDIVIGMTVNNAGADPYQTAYYSAAEEYAKTLGVDLKLLDPVGDVTKQQNQVQDLIGMNCDVIVLWPTNSESGVAMVRQINAAGIPVMSANTNVEESGKESVSYTHLLFIEAGFDALNPVQCSAAGMDAKHLKDAYGKDITFWGGGIDTQQILPFGTPEEVRKQVLERLEIFAPDGGYIFNSIHIVQCGTPVENIVAMIDAVHEFNGDR